ncbi:hypothetical protein ACTFIR_005292 [Dictyostelium discoideum]
MNRYMICLDGSQVSERAFHWLEALAMCDLTHQTEIFLFHVVDRKAVTKLELDTNPNCTRHELAEKALDEYTKSLAVNNIISHKLLIDTKESVKDVIIKEIEKNKIDMVVLGHEDKGRIERLLDGRGSVCEYLLKKVDIPITIFK